MNWLGGHTINRYIGQNVIQRLQLLAVRNNTQASAASVPSHDKPKIAIPLRKERSPTDILNALEKTIKQDPTAAHYKYHDDPFLIPMSNWAKRSYALSKESGRKAAMWILEEHASLFQHKLAEPEIPAFCPKPEYNEKEQVSEKILLTVIKDGSVTDSIKIYNLLEANVSIATKQALLELLCFYNSQEQIPDSLLEEKWFSRTIQRPTNLWKSIPEVTQLFEFLKQQDKPVAAAAYNALISGMAKYSDAEHAWDLFAECNSNQIPLNLTCYNLLISTIPLMKDGTAERQAMLLNLLQKIQNEGLQPNIATFNAALRVASSIEQKGNARKKLLTTLFAEFEKIGVAPSLASYYYLLVGFYKNTKERSDIIFQIIEKLERDETITIQDEIDTFFFVTAMDIARCLGQNADLGYRIHKLLLKNDNYKFIGESFKESVYYRHFLLLMIGNLPFDEFVKLYDSLVPNVYIPEPSVMMEILRAMEWADEKIVNDFLPRLWSQIVMFDLLNFDNMVSRAINLIRNHSSLPTDSPLHLMYANAMKDLWDHLQTSIENGRKKENLSGQLLGDIAVLCVRGDEFGTFLKILTYIKQEEYAVVGSIKVNDLEEMLDACLKRNHVYEALDILQYCVDAGYKESAKMAKQISSSVSLTSNQKVQLSNILESEMLKTENPSDKAK